MSVVCVMFYDPRLLPWKHFTCPDDVMFLKQLKDGLFYFIN